MNHEYTHRIGSAHFPLRIALVAPPWYELPPLGYGGIEAVCAALANALVDRGHDVTLFGAGQASGTRATFVPVTDEPQHPNLGEELPAVLHMSKVNAMLARHRFDVIHDHALCGALTAAQRSAPTITTVHGPANGPLGDYYAALGRSNRLVAISDSQRRGRPDLNWVATVHNSVDPAAFGAPGRRTGPVLWLARFCPDKGPDLAIQACRQAGLPLVLAGKCTEASERRYFEDSVLPLVEAGDGVEVLLNGDRESIRDLLTEARCLIMPIRWEEPFGMVMIEAMACGTPVVAMRRGAAPEIIRHGVTGWLCDHPSELAEAMLKADEIGATECIEHVRATFNAQLMAARYEAVYVRAAASRMRAKSFRQPESVPA